MLDYSKPTPPLPTHAQRLSEQILRQWNDICSRRQHHQQQQHDDDDDDDDQLVDEEAVPPIPAPPPPLNQLTINEYMPGQGIAAHTDTKSCFGSLVFILNLGSGITMNLTKCRRKKEDCDDEGGGGGGGDDDDDDDSEECGEDDSSNRKCVFLPVRSLVRGDDDK